MNFHITQALALSLLVAACGGGAAASAGPESPKSQTPSDGNKTADTGAVKKPGEAEIGDKTTCPISKEVFTVSASSPKYEYKGKTYYFCCGGCDSKFKENPDKYLTTPAAGSSGS